MTTSIGSGAIPTPVNVELQTAVVAAQRAASDAKQSERNVSGIVDSVVSNSATATEKAAEAAASATTATGAATTAVSASNSATTKAAEAVASASTATTAATTATTKASEATSAASTASAAATTASAAATTATTKAGEASTSASNASAAASTATTKASEASTSATAASGSATAAASSASAAAASAATAAAYDPSTYLSKADNLASLADKPTARSNLGLATVAATGSYNDLSGKPSIPTWPVGYISGLTLMYASTTTFTIAAGDCRNEDGGTAFNMSLSASITKSLSAWAALTGNGSLDTGSIASNTWYHIHLIRKTSDGSLDVLLSLSSSAPTMPTGYVARRRLGSIKTNDSSQLTQWTQFGDEFLWSEAVVDFDVVNPGTTAVLRALSVPTGVQVLAKCLPTFYAGTYTNTTAWFSSPDTNDQTPQTKNNTAALTGVMSSITATSAPSWQMAEYFIRTNTSAQIRTRLSVSGYAERIGCITRGWIDSRGKN